MNYYELLCERTRQYGGKCFLQVDEQAWSYAEFQAEVEQTAQELPELDGSVLWICKSPYRPGHKRKNWYVDVSILDQVPRISEERMVRFETFCSGGKGGQHVNKVETGVRIIHVPTGISVVSTEARSQGTELNDETAPADYAAILDAIAAALPGERAKKFHAHFSRIAYTKGGEKCHLTFADTEFGPPPAPLMQLLKTRGLAPTIICESAGTQAEDAAALKKLYEQG